MTKGDLELLHQAKQSPRGIVVLCSDVAAVANRMAVTARKEGITGLSFRQSPISPNELWIVKIAEQQNASDGDGGDPACASLVIR